MNQFELLKNMNNKRIKSSFSNKLPLFNKNYIKSMNNLNHQFKFGVNNKNNGLMQ